MKVRILFLVFLSILAGGSAFGQTKAVTNADLEKYRQKRLLAEKDYRENYAKLGFPSPEELERQNEKSRVEREALAARLTSERLQREKAEAELEEAARNRNIYVVSDQVDQVNPGFYGYYPNTTYFGRRFPRVKHYNYPVRVGNGIPIVNYYGIPSIRRVRPTARWLRP